MPQYTITMENLKNKNLYMIGLTSHLNINEMINLIKKDPKNIMQYNFNKSTYNTKLYINIEMHSYQIKSFNIIIRQ